MGSHYVALVSNSWAQVILLNQAPEHLGRQVCTSTLHAWLHFKVLVEMESHHSAQLALKLLGSSNPALASENAGITGVSYRVQPG